MAEHGNAGDQLAEFQTRPVEVGHDGGSAYSIYFNVDGQWRQVVCPIGKVGCDGCPGRLLEYIATSPDLVGEYGRVRAMLEHFAVYQDSDQDEALFSFEFELGVVGANCIQVFALHDSTSKVHLFGFFDPLVGHRRKFILCYGYLGRRKRATQKVMHVVGQAAEKIGDWWGSRSVPPLRKV